MEIPRRIDEGLRYRRRAIWGSMLIGALCGFALGAIPLSYGLGWVTWSLVAIVAALGGVVGYISPKSTGLARDFSAPTEVARIRRNSEIMGRIMIVGGLLVLVAKMLKSIFG